MAAPGHVFTISRAAEILGEDEDLLWELAGSLEPEDGCLWIYDTGDRQMMAFTDRGLECLQELIADHQCSPLPPRPRADAYQDRDVIAITGLAIGPGERMRQQAQPLA